MSEALKPVKPLSVVYDLKTVMNAVSAKLGEDKSKLAQMALAGNELTKPALESSVKTDEMDFTMLTLWDKQGVKKISAEQPFSDSWADRSPLSPPQNTLHEQLRRSAIRLIW